MSTQFPPLIFGSTCLGNLFRIVPDEDKSAIVSGWVSSGLSPVVIDSAGKYGAGLSLEVIGKELNELSADPKDVLVSNKLGWRRIPLQGSEPTFEPGAWYGLKYDAVQDISYAGIMRCYAEGLELLHDYPSQLVSVHDPDEYLAAAENSIDRSRRLDDILEAYRALGELKARGEVSAVGVGAKDWHTIRELCDHVALDWVMFANSLTIMRHPRDLVEFIEELDQRGVVVINSALFHGGFLLGGDYFDYRKVDPQNPAGAAKLEWRARFKAVCLEFDVSPFAVGVAFGKAHPGVASVALSTSRAERIASHLQTLQTEIPPALWAQLRAAGLIDSACQIVPSG